MLGSVLYHQQPTGDQLKYALDAGLEPVDFSMAKHRQLFEAMIDARGDDGGRDYFETVWKNCTTKVIDLDVGYLNTLMMDHGGAVPNSALTYHARALKKLSFERQEVTLVSSIYADLQSGFSADQSLDDLQDLRERRQEYDRGEPESFGNGIKGWWEKVQRLSQDSYKEPDAIPCPIPSILSLTQGFRRSEVSVIAGTPGSGKSALALNCIVHAVQHSQVKTALLSLEMNLDEINARLVNQLCDVPLRYLLNPTLLQESKLKADSNVDGVKIWDELIKATHWTQQMAEHDVFQALSLESFSPTTVLAAVERAAGAGAEFIVVDHLHRLQFGDGGTYAEAMGKMCVSLTEIAKSTNTHVMALSQVNRASLKDGRQARMHDLKGSGGIEENASLILMLHRDIEMSPAEGNLYVAKARSGEAGKTIPLVFNGARMTFAERLDLPPEYGRDTDHGELG